MRVLSIKNSIWTFIMDFVYLQYSGLKTKNIAPFALKIILFMAQLLQLNSFSSENGNLTILENILPHDVKRLFYIYGAGGKIRGGHRHKAAWNALTCVAGECKVYLHDGFREQIFSLDSPTQCLVIEPGDWHQMYDFSENAILLGISDENYDKDDYVFEQYEKLQLQTA